VFVNEVIPEVDKLQHGFEENSGFYISQPSQWTVDRSRGMFLIHRLSYSPGGAQNVRFWAFSWGGKVFDVKVENISSETDANGVVHAKTRLVSIDRRPALEWASSEILNDLKEALSVYGVAGIFHPVKSFQLQLLIEDGGSTSHDVLH
jgi:hypothetical protein